MKRKDVLQFYANLENNLFQIYEDLVDGTYRHGKYTSFSVCDPKPRIIHKAMVRDRVVHHAVFRVLSPFFDRRFIHDSYSCRIGKGTHCAVSRLDQFFRKASKNNTRRTYVLQCDVRKFFDSIDHAILLELLRKRVVCPDALRLLEGVIRSFEKTCDKGLPLGNVTSQLFANVYLNELDQFVKHTLRIRYYIRYCDDFLVVHTDEEFLGSLVGEIEKFLQGALRLCLHPNKISIRKYRQGIDFCGYVTLPHARIIRTSTKKRMVKQLSNNNIASYYGICLHADSYDFQKELFAEL